jgi:UDP-N-acetylmuramoylalanine--D-glutamate ligase
MLDLKNKSICMLGYGRSNEDLTKYLLKKGFFPSVRVKDACDVPKGVKLICGKDFLKTSEDIVFRSPGIRPDLIECNGKISSETEYTFSLLKSRKIGITGSDGKSTTSTLIHNILQKEHISYLGGNIGNPLIEKAEKISPDGFAVLELSSFQLMDFCPELDIAVITNITENHLDWHTSMEEYINAKKNILKNAKTCVLNYDDEILQNLGNERTVFTTLSDKFHCSNTENDFVYLHDGYIYYNADKIANTDNLALKGEYNLRNILSAIGATYNFVSKNAIKDVISTFSGIECRREFIKKVRGVSFFNSSIDSTPSRTIATVSTFDKSKTIIILGGYDKNLDYSPLKTALDGIKAIVLCGENKNKIFEAVKNSNIGKIEFETDFETCIKKAYSLAQSGDFVLLSPASASFDMFKNYRERAVKFKEITNKLEC